MLILVIQDNKQNTTGWTILSKFWPQELQRFDGPQPRWRNRPTTPWDLGEGDVMGSSVGKKSEAGRKTLNPWVQNLPDFEKNHQLWSDFLCHFGKVCCTRPTETSTWCWTTRPSWRFPPEKPWNRRTTMHWWTAGGRPMNSCCCRMMLGEKAERTWQIGSLAKLKWFQTSNKV